MLAFVKGLGIGFLCLLLFIAGVIFNVEFLEKKNSNQALFFSRNIEVNTDLKPDEFYTNINFWANENLDTKITLSDEEKNQITNTFSQITQRAKKDNFCSGGSFSIEPNFSYKDGAQTIKGQKLNANLECIIKENELDNFNHFLNDLNSIVKKSSFVGVSIPTLEPKFSKQLLEENKEKLYDKLLQKAYSYEGIYSKDLNKSCTLKTLKTNLDPNITPRIFAAKSNDMQLALPIVKDTKQSLNATALFVCK
ncbi:hypothetical protein [Campylobacter estrildidarum]|uniref:SIMPL domain-containing protein n=1 Tax=Campylobacter estrildidarum TaxID=2510189 RepID=A0A4U7BIA4_9BACT|nr:hypothetical protein [Campylobacter estrildidarum]TKX31523.1 hypothetical protein CQA69_02565 [Campylobacter estrildidarum]